MDERRHGGPDVGIVVERANPRTLRAIQNFGKHRETMMITAFGLLDILGTIVADEHMPAP